MNLVLVLTDFLLSILFYAESLDITGVGSGYVNKTVFLSLNDLIFLYLVTFSFIRLSPLISFIQR